MTSLHVIKSQFFIYHDNLNLQPSKRGELGLWYKKKKRVILLPSLVTVEFDLQHHDKHIKITQILQIKSKHPKFYH